MIDPKSAQYEVWYQANLATSRQCEEWHDDIHNLKAVRALVDGAQRIAFMSHRRLQGYLTKAELAAHFENRGAEMRRFARSATRDELARRIIADRLAAIDAEIMRLEQLIADNRPDPRFRERKEGAIDGTSSTNH